MYRKFGYLFYCFPFDKLEILVVSLGGFGRNSKAVQTELWNEKIKMFEKKLLGIEVFQVRKLKGLCRKSKELGNKIERVIRYIFEYPKCIV